MVASTQTRFGWGFFVKLLITVGILGFLATLVEWPEIWSVVRHSNPNWLFLGFLCSATCIFLVALRWWLVLRIQDVSLPIRHVLKLNFIGQFFSAFLMGANGGDVVRIFYAIRSVPGQKAKVALTIVIDRFLGVSMLMVWMLVALPFEITRLARDPETLARIEIFKILLPLAVITGLVVLFLPYRRLPSWIHRLWQKIPQHEVIARLHADSRLYLRRWPLTAGALFTALTVHLLNFSAVHCLALALGLQVSFSSIILISALIMMAVGAPLSIGGHGVREVTVIALFKLFDVTPASQEVAVAFSLLFYLLFQFTWSALGGLVYLFYQRQVKLDDAAEPTPAT